MRFYLKIYYLFWLLVLVFTQQSVGDILFSARDSSISILPSGSLYIPDTSIVSGWSRESIVKSVDSSSPVYWDPSWSGKNITYEVAPMPDLPENKGDINLNTIYYELTTDLLLGPNRHLIIGAPPSSNYTLIQGNGYTINLAEGFSNLIQIQSGQTVEIKNAVIKNYDENGINFATGSTLKFFDSTIEITDNRTFLKPLNLSGDVAINGYGYTVSLATGASISIDTGQLTINNLVFYGISGQNLSCKTLNTSLILQNCNLFLTGDYRFKNGGLQMINSSISGFHGFNFESSLTFSVSRTVMLDTGVTFSYSPVNNRRDLIYMDDSSILYLNSCTVKSTTTGIMLKTGTLVIDGQNQMYNDGAVSLSQGIMFGDGHASRDLDIELLPGASLTLMSGKLTYANVN